MVVGTVPSDLVNQDKIKLILTAQSKNTNQQQSVNDELIISSSLGFNVSLSAANDLVVLPSQPVLWRHELKNTGSLADSYDILVSNLTGDNKDIANLQVFIDSNNNVKQEGQIDVEVEVTTQQLSNLNNQFVSYYKYGNEEKQAFSNVVTTLLQKNSFSLLIDNSLRLS